MALSDLKVFSEYAYSSFTETLDYNINLFNQATRGGLILQETAHQGDFSELAIWAKISGLVKRRNAYGAGAVAEKVLQQILDTSVKVAAGTPPVRIDPGMMLWIQRSPEEAGATVGIQMAKDSLADMLGTAILAFRTAHENVATNFHDAGAVNASLAVLNTGRAKLGDAAGEMVCWIMHSKPMFDIFGAALTNANQLFEFGTVRVVHDGFGNPFIVTDSPNLVVAGAPNTYRALGLKPAAVVIGRNNDFLANVETSNGDENIKRTYQAEWSYNVGVQGFAWDKTAGGKSPNDAALGAAANWDKYVTSFKDLGGIVVKSQ